MLWIAPGKTSVAAMLEELPKWGVRAVELPKSGQPVQHCFNVVEEDRLRDIRETLLERAARLLVVVDEVDTKYAQTKRTAACKSIVDACPKAVMMTATPIRNNKQEELASWLGRTVAFPVRKNNWLVAASLIINKRIDLGIAVRRELHRVTVADVATVTEYSNTLHQRAPGWAGRLARIAGRAVSLDLIDAASQLARPNDEGGVDGVLVEAMDVAHRDELLQMLAARGVPCGASDQGDNPAVKAVVVVKHEARAYNWGKRLGALVRGVVPDSAPRRKQMEGRLKRIGQPRNEVLVLTVVWAGSILERWHEAHEAADRMNRSLEALADEYSAAELMEALNK